jgi:CRISPR-associated exonuclease Cas4
MWGEPGQVVVTISAIEHHAYCRRQCALIHVDGAWVDNAATTAGTRAHRRVDSADHKRERGRLVLRSIPLWSERLGLAGRADAVEIWPDGTVIPVEYKSGVRHGLTADLQLCAQAMCLEEMFGTSVQCGWVWYGGPRRRHQVVLDDRLRSETVASIEQIRSDIVSGELPVPVNDDRCATCQLEPVCLPGVVAERRSATAYLRQEIFECGT